MPTPTDEPIIKHVRLCKHGHDLSLVGTVRDGRCKQCVREQAARRHERLPLYGSWKSMHERCSNPNHVAYDSYGGRGIKVCARWKSFEVFVEDVGERPPNPDGWTSKQRVYYAANKERIQAAARARRAGLA